MQRLKGRESVRVGINCDERWLQFDSGTPLATTTFLPVIPGRS